MIAVINFLTPPWGYGKITARCLKMGLMIAQP